jgi:uncharacterized protein
MSQGTSTVPTERIRTIDIVRGIAVLGILTINVSDMAYPEDLVLAFDVIDPERGWNFWTGLSLEVLFSGKMRGLFTVLFGVSSVLIIERLSAKMDGLAVAEVYFRRLLWLLVFGLVNAYVFLWWGDVLFKYAMLGMVLFPFRRASFAVLIAAILSCLAVLTIQPFVEYREMVNLQESYLGVEKKRQLGELLTADDQEVVAQWEDRLDEAEADGDAIEAEMEVRTSGYIENFQYNVEDVIEEQTTIFYEEDFWDLILYMFLGIMLFRLGFFDERTKKTVHLVVCLVGIGVGLTMHAWLNIGLQEDRQDVTGLLFYLIFVDLGRLPFVLGYLSLITLVFRFRDFQRLGDGMAAVGRMALSNYLLQSIFSAFVFYGFGLAQFNQLSRLDLAMLIGFVCLLQIAFSVIWMRWCYFGPFEWLWRSLTYWKVQPLLK